MKNLPAVKTPQEIAAIFGCSEQQAAMHLARNAMRLRLMQMQATKSRAKVNGYSASELGAHADRYESALSAN